MEQRIGPYSILQTIGRGAYGRVFRARAPDGGEVALKLLIGSLSPQSLGRFERERVLLSELGHEAGFVPLLDAGSSPHGPYVVMELMSGGSLRGRLNRGGRLDLADAFDLGRDLAKALENAHARGVVHRDIKPSNLLFTSSGELRVADLGLAKVFAVEDDALSKTGSLRGSIGYMPPEQMQDAKRAGPPADVFAWGAVLYEALTGQPAFGDGPPMEVIYKIEVGEFTPLRELCPQLPSGLTRLIEGCLSRDPIQRPADGRALALAFAIASAPPGAARSSPLLWGLISLALAVGGVGLGLSLAPGAPSSPSPAAPERSLDPTPASSAPLETPTPRALPEHPTPSPAPPRPSPAGPALPSHLSGLRRGRQLQLSQVLGDYRGKHTGLVTDVTWGPNGNYLASVSLSGWVHVWNPTTGDVLRALGTSQRLHVIDSGLEGWGVVGGGAGATLLRLEAPPQLVDLARRGKCVSARILPDGKRVVVSEGLGLSLYEVPTGRELWHVPDAHPGEGSFVNGLRHVPARREIVSAQASLRVWSEEGQLLRTYRLPRGFLVEDLAVSPSGSRIYLSSQTSQLIEFQREGSDDYAALDLGRPGYTRALELTSETEFFSGHDDGAILLRQGGRSQLVGQHRGWVHCLRRGPAGLLASGGNDSQLRVWRPSPAGQRETWSPAWTSGGHEAGVEQIAHQGARVYSRGRDGLRIWDRESGRQLQSLPSVRPILGRRTRIAIAVSPSGQRVLRLGLGLTVDDLGQGRLVTWNNTKIESTLHTPSFVDENTIAFVDLAGREQRLDIKSGQIAAVTGQEPLLGLRSVEGWGQAAVYADRVEVARSGGEVLRAAIAEQPQLVAIDSGGTVFLVYPGLLLGFVCAPDASRLDMLRVPLSSELSSIPAVSFDRRWLAFTDQQGLLSLIDLQAQPPALADRLAFAATGDSPLALSWSRDGDFWIGTAFGPVLRYRLP